MLRRLHAEGGKAWPLVRAQIETILGHEVKDTRDERIVLALKAIHAEPAAKHSLTELSRRAGLSSSRFIHLFKTATGVPLRRYKLWVAMGAAIRAIVQGESLTVASLEGGFASSSHFSAAFHEMFGMKPSRFAGGRRAQVATSADRAM